jgi:hypothetical protein
VLRQVVKVVPAVVLEALFAGHVERRQLPALLCMRSDLPAGGHTSPSPWSTEVGALHRGEPAGPFRRWTLSRSSTGSCVATRARTPRCGHTRRDVAYQFEIAEERPG